MELCTTWAHYFLGRIAYEWNDLGGAAEHFSAAIAGRGRCQTEMLLEASFGLALTYQAQGRPAEAGALLTESEALLDTMGDGESLPMVSSFRTRLALARGERPPSSGPEIAADPARLWTGYSEDSQLHGIRATLPPGGGDHDAMSRQGTFLIRDERGYAVHSLIEALAARALAQQDRGLEEAALDCLAQALTLAEPGGFVRTFVDFGAPMATLLRRLEMCRGSSAYLCALLATFPTATEEPLTSPAPPAVKGRADGRVSPSLSHDAMEALIEQLTNRELQVLARLDHHLTSKEIAAELSISPLTVKRHISNLTGKLGVSSRRLAVRRARTLGLLPGLVLR
jgi:LuxR family maltose regulon positive regulatory protein